MTSIPHLDTEQIVSPPLKKSTKKVKMLESYLRRLPKLLHPSEMKTFRPEERNYFSILVREDVLPARF